MNVLDNNYSDNSTNSAESVDNESVIEDNLDDILMNSGDLMLPNEYQNEDNDSII